MNIKNREEIIEQLTEMLMQFDKDCNAAYQTDVYLYYDKENQTAKLDTFVNVGGNSWLDDDHYTIYTDREHYDDGVFSYYQQSGEIAEVLESSGIAEVLEMSEEEFEAKIRQYYNMDEDENPDWYEICKFVKSNDEYMEKLTENYNDIIDGMRSEYAGNAERIIREFEEEDVIK